MSRWSRFTYWLDSDEAIAPTIAVVLVLALL